MGAPAIGLGVSDDYFDWYRPRTRLRILPPAPVIPDHGFRPVAGVMDTMKYMLRHDLRAFEEAGMQKNVDFLLAGFRSLGITPYGDPDEKPQPEGGESDHDDDDQGHGGGRHRGGGRGHGGGGRRTGTHTSEAPEGSRRTGGSGSRRTGGGGGRHDSSRGPYASRQPMEHDSSPTQQDDGDDTFDVDDEMEMETPYHHRHSVGSFQQFSHPPEGGFTQFSQSSSQRWDRGLPLTSHQRAPPPDSQFRDPRRTDETTTSTSSGTTSAGKRRPLSGLKNFWSRAKK